MDEKRRKVKSWRSSYVNELAKANVSIFEGPNEVRIMSEDGTFLTVREGGVSIAPGAGNNINIQGMPSNVKYAGMFSPMRFPLNLIPSTVVTPIPSHTIDPPLKELMSTIRTLSSLASLIPGGS